MLAVLIFSDYLKKVNSHQFGKTRTSEFKHVQAERRRNWGSNPNKGTVFSLLQSLQTGFGAHPIPGVLLVEEGRKAARSSS